MKGLPNFEVALNDLTGEIFVSDNDGGRYMCVFVSAGFISSYKAYGFMVWTPTVTKGKAEYFPIKLKEETKLTEDIMFEMWEQIKNKMK